METANVTRRFLRVRSAFSLGILLLAACVALVVTTWGRANVDRSTASLRTLDSALIVVTRMERSFDRYLLDPGMINRTNMRSELRIMSDQLTGIRAELSDLVDRAHLAPDTLSIMLTPSLNALDGLGELVDIAAGLSRDQTNSRLETRLAQVGRQLSARLLPVYTRMKETERLAVDDASRIAGIAGWLALAASVLAILGAIRFVHLPMERRIMAAQIRIEEGKRAAEAASEAKSQFLATMSHEFRTPMNGIIGMAEVLRQTDLPPRQAKMVDVIFSSGMALTEIIDEVLDLSKIEAGKLDITCSPRDVAEVTRDVHRLFRGRAEIKGLSLTLDIQPAGADWRRMVDAKALRQIMSNLVNNAVKFTNSGTITLSLAPDTQRGAGSPGIVITIRDEGIGIPQEAHDRIFQSFEQVDSSTTRRYGGTGLGLSIVRKLVEAMDGSVSVQSRPGQGSTFTVRLPLAFVEPDAVDTGRTAPMDVLLAADNGLNTLVTTRLLEEAGHSVRLAKSGAEACEMVEAMPPDLILMDARVPGTGGLQAVTMIRDRERLADQPPVPVIAMAPPGSDYWRTDMDRLGIHGQLATPVEAQALFDALAEI